MRVAEITQPDLSLLTTLGKVGVAVAKWPSMGSNVGTTAALALFTVRLITGC